MTDDIRTVRRNLADLAATVRQFAQAAVRSAQSVPAATLQRFGFTITGPFGPGSTDVTVVWPQAWPDAGYGVLPSIICGTAALGSLSATLKSGTKTVNGCVVTVANTGASPVGTFGLDVLGVRA